MTIRERIAKMSSEVAQFFSQEKFESARVKDSDIELNYPLLEAGAPVTQPGQSGSVPVPDGTYELETGETITIKDGLIESIEGAQEETEATEAPEEAPEAEAEPEAEPEAETEAEPEPEIEPEPEAETETETETEPEPEAEAETESEVDALNARVLALEETVARMQAEAAERSQGSEFLQQKFQEVLEVIGAISGLEARHSRVDMSREYRTDREQRIKAAADATARLLRGSK